MHISYIVYLLTSVAITAATTRAGNFSTINVDSDSRSETQCRRNGTIQFIILQIQDIELRQTSKCRWNCTAQLIIIQTQEIELRQ